MLQLIMLIIPLLLVLFWAWMFKAMTENQYLPPCFFSVTNGTDPRFDWSIAFVILNIFTAIYYYFTEYRSRQ